MITLCVCKSNEENRVVRTDIEFVGVFQDASDVVQRWHHRKVALTASCMLIHL